MRQLLLILPLLLFVAMGIFFASRLALKDSPENDPFAGRDLPYFQLASLYDGGKKFSSDQLKGRYTLLNIFASWCLMCVVEHPLLMQLSEKIDIYAINWKDEKPSALSWLKTYGNPYKAIGYDFAGDVAIDLGVTGAPETLLIGPDGKVILRHKGPLNQESIDNLILSKVTP